MLYYIFTRSVMLQRGLPSETSRACWQTVLSLWLQFKLSLVRYTLDYNVGLHIVVRHGAVA
jgi:hypothetical protein